MNEINHNGIISGIKSGVVEVLITDNISCDGCGIKNACISGGKKDNVFFVDSQGQDFSSGDRVQITLSHNRALNAVVWAYIFPFIVMIVSLVILSLFFNELMAGLISFVLLAVYYFLIFLNKKYFNKRFRLKLKNISDE